MEIKITKSRNLKEKPDSNGLGFGQIFSDHMFMMDYTQHIQYHAQHAHMKQYLHIDIALTAGRRWTEVIKHENHSAII